MFSSEHLVSVEKSQTLLLNEQSRQLESEGQDIVKFGFGQSPFLPPQWVRKELAEHAAAKEYTPVQGLAALRETVAEFHGQLEGREVQAQDVFIAPGSKILLYCILRTVTQADVLIPAPAWVSYAPQASLCGHTAIRLTTSHEARWRVTPEVIEDAVRSKKDAGTPTVMILNYPGNPDGLSYTAEELEAIAQIVRKHQILVISDEIYGLLHHQGEHISLARYCPERTIVTTGLSKWCGAGGWRLGVALLPADCNAAFREGMLGIASETYSCAPAPVQYAAITAYQDSDALQQYLQGQRKALAFCGGWSQQQLVGNSQVRVHPPEGGFYLFLDFMAYADALKQRGINDSDALCMDLLAKTGVAILPGTAFGMEPDYYSARLAYVDFDGEAVLQKGQYDISHDFPNIEAGIKRIIGYFDSLAG